MIKQRINDITTGAAASASLRWPLRQALRSSTEGRVNAFLMHRVANPDFGINGHTPEGIRSCLEALSRHRISTLSLKDLLEAVEEGKAIPPEAVFFTMDDGYWDQAEVAAPIFAEFGVPLTIFLITGFLDGKLWPWDAQISYLFQRASRRTLSVPWGRAELAYDIRTQTERTLARRRFLDLAKQLCDRDRSELIERLSESSGIEIPESPPPEYRPMSWASARRLEGQGVSFGSHSVSHRIFSKLDEPQATQEIGESIGRLAEELDHPLAAMAWPIGRQSDFGRRDLEICANHGIKIVFSADGIRTRLGSGRSRPQRPAVVGRQSMPQSCNEMLWTISSPLRDSGSPALSSFQPIRPTGPKDLLRKVVRRRYGNRENMQRHGMSLLQPRLDRDWNASRIDWVCVNRLVFVCKGNICRSPFAEHVARKLGLDSLSIGLEAKPGAPADGRAVEAALMMSLDMGDHRSRSLAEVQLQEEDLVLGMEAWHLEKLSLRNGARKPQLSLLGAWCEKPTRYIPDPYGCDLDFFLRCFKQISGAVLNLRTDLLQKRSP